MSALGTSSNDNNTSNMVAIESVASTEVAGAELPLYPSLGASATISLQEYLSRKVLVYTYNTLGPLAAPLTMQYATDFFNLDSIAQKIKFFHLLRGTFHIDFVVNVNPFCIGQFIGGCYMYGKNTWSAPNTNFILAAAQIATMTHVVMDCSLMNSGTLKVPMHIKYPYANVSITDDPTVDQLYCDLTNLTPMVNSFDGTNCAGTVNVYLSLHDTEITVPVVMDTRTIYTMESVRPATGVVSYPASIAAFIGRSLKDVPIIGKFAYATSMAASAVSNIAVLFGMSRPRDTSLKNYPHESDFASYAGDLESKNITLDPQQEVPIDCSFLGDEGDSLTFKNTICREGILNFFNFTTASALHSVLFQYPVCPHYTPITTGTLFIPTPLGYASQLYSLWRGTIRYKITLPSNTFVKGKLRFYWNPNSTTSTNYNNITQNGPSVLLDLAVTTEVCIDIPWAHQYPYLNVNLMSNAAVLNTECNGYINCVVEQTLVSQAAALTLTGIIRMSAGDDFELHIPTNSNIMYIKRQAYSATYPATVPIYTVANTPFQTPATGLATTAPTNDVYTLWTMQSNANNPMFESCNMLMPQIPDKTAVINHVGEKNSFRSLFKRFFYYHYNPGVISTGGNLGPIGYFIPFFPIDPYLYGVAPANTMVNIVNTPIRYITNLFAGYRGSIRYRINPYFVGTFGKKISVFRYFGLPFQASYTVDTHQASVSWSKLLTGMGEAAFAVSMSEPFYFDIPWQCVSQFFSTQINTDLTVPQYGFMLYFDGVDSSNIPFDVYCSAGEDFSPTIWNGVPIVSIFSAS